VQQAQGALGVALKSYQAGMTIAQKLAAADPGNAQWQRDVAVSCWKLAKLGSLAGSIESRRELLRTGLAILAQQKNANHLPASMLGLIEDFNAALRALN
jgi:hypothetical protein